MVTIDVNKCIGCGSCVKDCTSYMIRLEEGKAKVLGSCFECGHCVCVCPTNAVSMEGYDMSEVDDIPAGGAALDPNALLQAIKSRRSIRQFRDQPVEKEKLDMILQAARFTPTGSNLQDVNFIVLQDRLEEVTKLSLAELRKIGESWLALDSRTMLQERYAKRWSSMERQYYEKNRDGLFFHAPVVLVFTGKDQINASLAAASAELMANAQGLGCVFVGFFRAASETPVVREALGLEDGRQVVCTLALGYPNVRYYRTAPRKEREIKYM